MVGDLDVAASDHDFHLTDESFHTTSTMLWRLGWPSAPGDQVDPTLDPLPGVVPMDGVGTPRVPRHDRPRPVGGVAATAAAPATGQPAGAERPPRLAQRRRRW